MRLVVLKAGRFQITAPYDPRDADTCAVVEELVGYGTNYERSVAGLTILIDRFAAEGPSAIALWSHIAGPKKEGIYRLEKGDLRLYYFMGDGAIVICTSTAIKKTQRTDKTELARAIAVAKEYRAASKSGTVEVTALEGDILEKIRPASS